MLLLTIARRATPTLLDGPCRKRKGSAGRRSCSNSPSLFNDRCDEAEVRHQRQWPNQPAWRGSGRATLEFLPAEDKYCCGEPQCHLGLMAERLDRVAARLREALHTEAELTLRFEIDSVYRDGVHLEIGEP